MNKTAIYPGTFDPITFGHIDVIKKGLKLFDKVVVAVSDVENKDYLFTSDERIEIVKKALFSDLKLNKKKILRYGSLQICFFSGASIPNNLIFLLLISNESPSITFGIPSNTTAWLSAW